MTTEPFAIFDEWYQAALENDPIAADVMVLASSSPDGRPSCRMISYRGIREGGFSFFTNYESRKGIELDENPFVALVFYWPHIGKQVRVEGRTERLSASESDRYFRQRSLASQLTALVSPQSRSMPSENELNVRLTAYKGTSPQDPPPRPSYWGGFKVIPGRFEFWTHGDYRRHHRMVFESDSGMWKRMFLYP